MALILASTSPIRRALIEGAGIACEVRSPQLDEDDLKQEFEGADLALKLARAKALSVDAGPDDWVIGSDSTLMVDGKSISKARGRDGAAEHLRLFSGRTMMLSSAVALANNAMVDWSHCETATLHVRTLSEDFIQSYLDAEWPDVAYCVGVFRMEGRGASLFDRVEGSHFTILGLPLLPLLGALRQRGLAAS